MACLAIALPAGMLAASAQAGQAHVAKHHKKHHKKKHHAGSGTTGGPSLTVVGFGVNHLYVADGATISDAADCSTMVQGNGYLDGPPQNIYINAYVKATGIPTDAATQIGEDFPGADATVRMSTRQLQLSPAVPWSQALSASTLGFGTPPGSQKDIFRGGLFGENDPNGPSASDFNGSYSFEVSVDVNGNTLDSTATATVNCPYG